jgi:hypothetical protein
MKRIILTEEQYKRLIKKNLNEQKIVFSNPKDEFDITNQMMQLLIHLEFFIDTIANKFLYIDKVENGIIYIDSAKYTKEEKDLINTEIDKWIVFTDSTRDKRSQDLTYNFGVDSDWDDLYPNEDIAVVDNDNNSATDDIDLDDNSTAEVEEEIDISDIEACKWGKNASGKDRKVILPSKEDIEFYKDVLKGIGANVTCEKMLFFFAWRSGESSDSSFNPFATTYKDTDNECCYYNCLKNGVGYKPIACRTCPEGTSPGVRNYLNKKAGVNATVNTIKARYYPNLLRRLRNDNSTAMDLASETKELSVWGTGSLPKQILEKNSTVNPKKIKDYNEECSESTVVKTDCELTTEEVKFFNKHIRNDDDNLDFRYWVNQDSQRIDKVNKKLVDCGLKDPKLDINGSKNEHLEIAFALIGKDWVKAGKPKRPDEEVKVEKDEDNKRDYNKNGRLDSSELTKIMNDTNGRTEYLSKAAAIQFNKMVVDAKKEGKNITISDAYRLCGSPNGKENVFTQWKAWKIYLGGGNVAAEPNPSKAEKWNELPVYPNAGCGYCTSNHGWGNAIDVADGKKWIRENGEKYGWYWGEAKSESWHFTFCGEGVVNTPKYCKGKKKVETELPKKTEEPKKSEDAPTIVGNSGYILGKQITVSKNGPADHATRKLGNWQSDNATDIFGKPGTTVYSITKGTVSKIGGNDKDHTGKIYGGSITVKGKDGYCDIFYTHLQKIKVEKGQEVTLGTPLAEISLWHTSPTGSHVHVGLPYKKNLNSLLNLDTGKVN